MAEFAPYMTIECPMAKRTAPLAELVFRKSRYNPDGKGNRLFDGGGLYLELRPSGARLWRLKYRFAGKEQLMSIGSYPDVTSAQARVRRSEVKSLLDKGVDPAALRRQEKLTRGIEMATTFQSVATEWIERFSPNWAHSHTRMVKMRLENDVYPWLGRVPIADLKPQDLLPILVRVEKRGAQATAHRIRQCMSLVFRYAIATGRAERDPAGDLRGALRPAIARRYATTTDPSKIGALLRAIDSYEGSLVVRAALQLLPLLFVRPGELRGARWEEINLEAWEWRIPAARLKLRYAEKLDTHNAGHVVPLSTQAMAVIERLLPMTSGSEFVLPSIRSLKRPLGECSVNIALRRLGFGKDEIVGHGFRHMASTLLNEQAWSADAIERQLAHRRKGVRGTYNLAEYLPERRKMMQAWADYLDGLRASI